MPSTPSRPCHALSISGGRGNESTSSWNCCWAAYGGSPDAADGVRAAPELGPFDALTGMTGGTLFLTAEPLVLAAVSTDKPAGLESLAIGVCEEPLSPAIVRWRRAERPSYRISTQAREGSREGEVG